MRDSLARSLDHPIACDTASQRPNPGDAAGSGRRAGAESVVRGTADIALAHRPNADVEIARHDACLRFHERLVATAWR